MSFKDPEVRREYHRQYYWRRLGIVPAPPRHTMYGRRTRVRLDGLTVQQRRWRRYQTLVRAAKAVPCADCGVQYPYYVMDFDHVRGEKLFEISAGHRHIALLLDEIAKCDVVCANCHRARTFRNLATVQLS